VPIAKLFQALHEIGATQPDPDVMIFMRAPAAQSIRV